MLTDLQIKALKKGTVKDSDKLYLRVLPSGSKQWIFRYMKNKKTVSKSLGMYPEVSAKEARQKVIDLTATTQNDKSLTFEEIYLKWMDFKSKTVKNFREIGLRFDKVLMPVFAKRSFDSIETVEIVNALMDYTEQGTVKLESARRLGIWLHQMEVYAVNYGLAKYYRFQGITAVIPSPKSKSLASIPPSELSDFFAKFIPECRNTRKMFDLTMVGFYTLLRPGEYTVLRWSWYDEEAGLLTIPAEVMKMKKPHTVPVSTQLADLFKALKLTKVNDFVFPSPIKPDCPIVQESMEKFFRNHGFKGILVPHGIRSIGRTWMAENSVEFEVSEHCLAHAHRDAVVAAYNRTTLLEKRKVVMQQWCDFVESCLSSKK